MNNQIMEAAAQLEGDLYSNYAKYLVRKAGQANVDDYTQIVLSIACPLKPKKHIMKAIYLPNVKQILLYDSAWNYRAVKFDSQMQEPNLKNLTYPTETRFIDALNRFLATKITLGELTNRIAVLDLGWGDVPRVRNLLPINTVDSLLVAIFNESSYSDLLERQLALNTNETLFAFYLPYNYESMVKAAYSSLHDIDLIKKMMSILQFRYCTGGAKDRLRMLSGQLAYSAGFSTFGYFIIIDKYANPIAYANEYAIYNTMDMHYFSRWNFGESMTKYADVFDRVAGEADIKEMKYKQQSDGRGLASLAVDHFFCDSSLGYNQIKELKSIKSKEEPIQQGTPVQKVKGPKIVFHETMAGPLAFYPYQSDKIEGGRSYTYTARFNGENYSMMITETDRDNRTFMKIDDNKNGITLTAGATNLSNDEISRWFTSAYVLMSKKMRYEYAPQAPSIRTRAGEFLPLCDGNGIVYTVENRPCKGYNHLKIENWREGNIARVYFSTEKRWATSQAQLLHEEEVDGTVARFPQKYGQILQEAIDRQLIADGKMSRSGAKPVYNNRSNRKGRTGSTTGSVKLPRPFQALSRFFGR